MQNSLVPLVELSHLMLEIRGLQIKRRHIRLQLSLQEPALSYIHSSHLVLQIGKVVQISRLMFRRLKVSKFTCEHVTNHNHICHKQHVSYMIQISNGTN